MDFLIFWGGEAGILFSGAGLWRLRAGSVWVARMLGFLSILGRERCAARFRRRVVEA